MGRWTRRAHEMQSLNSNLPAAPEHSPGQYAGVPDDPSDVQWRTVAFRAIIPAHGPIWPPRIRTTPLCDTPGYCSLCGDELPLDPVPRFRRCAVCVQALWLAMNEIREGVVAEDEFTRADAP
jgi:hypothetical protein